MAAARHLTRAAARVRVAAHAKGLRFIACADGRFALVHGRRIVLSRRSLRRLERDFAAGVNP